VFWTFLHVCHNIVMAKAKPNSKLPWSFSFQMSLVAPLQYWSNGAHNKHKVWNLVLNINGQSPNLELTQCWKFMHLHANIGATKLQSPMQCCSVHLPKAQGDCEISWT
jgi:hypothetical protein